MSIKWSKMANCEVLKMFLISLSPHYRENVLVKLKHVCKNIISRFPEIILRLYEQNVLS